MNQSIGRPFFFGIILSSLTVLLGSATSWADEQIEVPADLVRVHVEPQQISLRGPRDRAQLVVTGETADGKLVDLTSAIRMVPADGHVAVVEKGNVVVALRPGTTHIGGSIGSHRVEAAVTVQNRATAEPVSFRHEVVPALTRAGCSAGTCHGTPTGKNGFRLSLRGYDPDFDFMTLTREADGRRINRLSPHDSLILQKAAAEIPHQGGRRFGTGDVLYQLLSDWIGEGAASDSAVAAPVARLTIFPQSRVLDAPADSQQLRVVAHYEDGSQRDVTHLARLSVNDETMAQVDRSGRVSRLKRGEVAVSAEYNNDLVAARIVFLEPVEGYAWPDPPENNYVDEHLFARLKLLRIAPAQLTTDEEFVRRVYLDVIGALPEPDEVRRFLEDGGADKRSRLIDQLLERPEFADWWAMKWTDRLGCNQRFVGRWGAIKYHRWIRNAMARNMPEDEFVRTILTAGGPNYSIPPAGFWRRLRKGGIGKTIDPLLAAEEISQLFLGVRIQCARCHNHPGEKWTQDDYYGLAAFFPRVKFKEGPYVRHVYDKEDTVYVVQTGEVKHPRTGKTMSPTLLGGATITDGKLADRRVPFAEWVTSPENPYFAKASVNRIWFHLFGRGIVHPVDDFRSSNPPAHPELLDALAADFVAHNFDRKQVIRTILNSRAYQLSSRTGPSNRDDEKYFSHARVRILQAEQLLDAISQVSGVDERFSGFPAGTSAISLPDGEYKHPFLEAFGRPARALACECERDPDTNFSQALHLVGGRIVHDKIKSDSSRAAALAASDRSGAQIVEELFLAAFARRPGAAETKLLTARFEAAGANRRRAAEDILWALINHREFLFQR